MRLYTLKDAENRLNVGAGTLKKYCRWGLIGRRISPAEEGPDRRPWYLTEEDLDIVRAIPHQAHKPGRPKKGQKRWLEEQSDRYRPDKPLDGKVVKKELTEKASRPFS